MISFMQFQTAAKHIGILKGAVDNKNGPDSKNAASEFLIIIQQILSLPDTAKTQLENIELKAKLKQINQISDI
jgi:hypothetical protein